jgi:hypothetical protein
VVVGLGLPIRFLRLEEMELRPFIGNMAAFTLLLRLMVKMMLAVVGGPFLLVKLLQLWGLDLTQQMVEIQFMAGLVVVALIILEVLEPLALVVLANLVEMVGQPVTLLALQEPNPEAAGERDGTTEHLALVATANASFTHGKVTYAIR